MTAAKHAAPVPHPLLRHLYELTGDLAMALWRVMLWLQKHFFGVVVTEVTAAFVTALGFAFVVAQLPVLGVVVFVVAIPVTAVVAYKAGAKTR